MVTPDDDAVERFIRRTQRTDDATLHRNLKAGVYGAPGSARRTVAERALDRRFTERGQDLQLATKEEAIELDYRTERITRMARRARLISYVAFAVAAFGLARSCGWI